MSLEVTTTISAPLDPNIFQPEFPSDKFSWRERAVLKNATIHRKFFSMRSEGKNAEAKSYLDYEVSILRIHETNSKSPIRAGKV
jgi:hypothetical protein